MFGRLHCEQKLPRTSRWRLPLAHIFSIAILGGTLEVGAAEMKGDIKAPIARQGAASDESTNTSLAPASKSRIILKGGADDRAILKPSLKVLPHAGRQGTPSLSGSQSKNLNLLWNNPTFMPPLHGIVPFREVRSGDTDKATGQMRGIIPPIYTQRFSHGGGVTTYVPGHEVHVIPGAMQNSRVPQIPAWTAPQVPRNINPGFMPSFPWRQPQPSFPISGQVSTSPYKQSDNSWIFWYSSLQPARDTRPVTDKPPDSLLMQTEGAQLKSDAAVIEETYKSVARSVANVQSRQHPIAQQDASKTSIRVTASRPGLICWQPGYEVTIEPPPSRIKESLGGSWSHPSADIVDALRARPEKLQQPRALLKTEIEAPPLMAHAGLLPGLKEKTASLNWDDWYKRVAKSVYDRWQEADVGPGLAKVRVTVTRGRQMSGQLIDFTPALGVERNVQAETAFREAAVRAVNQVYDYELPEFPSGTQEQSVTFDVQMKRTVDGQAGFDVESTGR